jgi:predicted dehydrogenase
VKALIAGLGSIGQRHVRNLRQLVGPDIEVIAYRARRLGSVVTDRLEVARGEDVEEALGVRAFTDLDGALAERPDIAFICNPSGLHMAVASRAAACGAHLFIEKPLSDRLEGVAELIATTERRRLVAAVGCQLRFHPCLARARDLVNTGAIGRVVAARVQVGEYLPGWHPYEDYRESYAARRDLGGGVVLTLIHELDYAYWLFGMPHRVFALGGHLSRLEMDVEDTASILLECRAADGRPIPVHVQMDYLQRPPSRNCEIVGDNGRIAVDLRVPSLVAYGSDGAEIDRMELGSFERNSLFLDELSNFMASVEGRERPAVSLREGADTLRIALAAKESIATGAVISLQ